MATQLYVKTKKGYIYENNNFKTIKFISDDKLNAIIELKSEDFLTYEDDTFDKKLSIKYDLDNNGIEDEISGKYWERWGSLFDCTVILNHKELELEDVIGAPKRIGVLESKTNDVHDLVIGCDEILKWNGYTYEKK
ncbi:hypothetical protein [Fulvivirga sediminis]|uniref:Uncharacterized protein n=1 Tax=Fulvivirga sediminis TaxID=2803949 RepID=A0A937JZW7_9BACT|nr:hypothetical protein [Fulvivirga sediminis]MBL3654867.1 hypothetical protein [Fulvivirga sediminis]